MPDNSANTNQKQLLPEVVIIRLVLIVLLVLYHSFAPYCGAWKPLEGQEMIPSYWWIGKAAYAFMLEAFVFISGYVLGYQVRRKGEQILEFKSLIAKKFKRLIIPSIIFSIIYILIFGAKSDSWYKIIYDIFNGVGHMWFLPMLFWCFVIVSCIEKLSIKKRYILPLVVIVSLFDFVPIPLRINNAIGYLPFFYVGYLMQKESWSKDWLKRDTTLWISVVAFIIVFVLGTILVRNIEPDGASMLLKAILLITANCIRLLYSATGLLMLLSIVAKCTTESTQIGAGWIKLSGYCFGVYLFQQFILLELYSKHPIIGMVSSYAVPWIGFIITMLISLLLTYITLRTKFGRYLIG